MGILGESQWIENPANKMKKKYMNLKSFICEELAHTVTEVGKAKICRIVALFQVHRPEASRKAQSTKFKCCGQEMAVAPRRTHVRLVPVGRPLAKGLCWWRASLCSMQVFHWMDEAHILLCRNSCSV